MLQFTNSRQCQKNILTLAIVQNTILYSYRTDNKSLNPNYQEVNMAEHDPQLPANSQVQLDEIVHSLSEFERAELRMKLVASYLRDSYGKVLGWHNSLFIALLLITFEVLVLGLPVGIRVGLKTDFAAGLAAFGATAYYKGLLWGLLGAVFFIGTVKFLLSRYIRNIAQQKFPEFQIRELQLPLLAPAAFEACLSSLSVFKDIRMETIDRGNGTLRAVTALSWQSSGEVLEIKIEQLSPDVSRVRIYSKTLIPQTLDFGKNHANVCLLAKYIETAVNPSLPSNDQIRTNQIDQIVNSLSEFEQDELRMKLFATHLHDTWNRLMDKRYSLALNWEYVKISGLFVGILGLLVGIIIGWKGGFIVGLNTFAAVLAGGCLWGLCGAGFAKFYMPRLIKNLDPRKSGALQVRELQVPLLGPEAFEACISSLSAIKDIKIEAINRENKTLRAITASNWRSPGEVIGVKIEQLTPDASKIHVYSKTFSLLDFGKNRNSVDRLAKSIEYASLPLAS